MNIVQHALIFLIRLYQTAVSPLLAAVLGPSARCRFAPSCSQYAREAVCRHGAMLGCWLALRRLGRCHPWGESGHDPVPEADGFGSATVPVALAGVSPASSKMIQSSPVGQDSDMANVFGETPKTAVETTALPKAIYGS